MVDDVARHELELAEDASDEYVEMVDELEILQKQASKAEVELAELQSEVNIKQKALDYLEEQITKLEYKIDNYGTDTKDEDGI